MFLILSLPQTEKTYPMGQKYMNPYYLMRNYYSVHPVPSEKRQKKAWIREISHFYRKEMIYFLCSYSDSIWNLSAILIIGSFLSIYHFKSVFSRKVTSDHSLVWNTQKPQTSLTYQFVLPNVFRVGLAEVWHFWIYHAEPGEKLGLWGSSKAAF